MRNNDIDSLSYHAIDLLKRLITVPSYSGNEEMAAKIIANDLKNHKVRFLEKSNNLWTYVKKSDKPKVLLNSHLDTIYPCNGWSYSPFAAIEKQGKIIGLGANDAGASLVSLLMAYYVLKDENLPYDLVFSATAEEEITGKLGITSILKLVGSIDLAIIGEPTSMKLAIGEKGLMVVDLKSEGEVKHVAHFNGKNAIDLAFMAYQKLAQIKFEDAHSKLGPTKLSITQIHAGKQHNVTPSDCAMVLDVRTNEVLSNREVLSQIENALDLNVSARSTRLNASFIDENHAIVKLAYDLGIDCFVSNTISDQSMIPYPSVKIGPGDSLRSHTCNEFIYIDEIREGIIKYIEILSNLKLS